MMRYIENFRKDNEGFSLAVTIYDVAKKAEVSPATVSRYVMNKKV